MDKNRNIIKNQLRSKLREKRNQISLAEQKTAARKINNSIIQSDFFKKCQNIAIYMPYNNEVDITELLVHSSKNFYLPVVTPNRDLKFAAYKLNEELIANQYGIEEPKKHDFLPANHLDLVFLPLLGFDLHGHRLGSGLGYYDKTFAFTRKNPISLLIGVGYECQKVEEIPIDEWDIFLSGIQTEEKFYQSKEILY